MLTIGILALLSTSSALATSYTKIPTIDDVVESSTVILHGTVSSISDCEGSRAWTYITLDVDNVIRGQLGAPPSFAAGSSSSATSSSSSRTAASSASPAIYDWGDSGPAAATCSYEGVWTIEEALQLDEGYTSEDTFVYAPQRGVTCADESWFGGVAEKGLTGDDQNRKIVSSTSSAQSSSESYTFRMPYGEYADGTFGTVVDSPSFAIGEEVIVALQTDASGHHGFIPFDFLPYSVFRVFRSGQGNSAVVNGVGQVALYSKAGVPVMTRGRAPLRAMYFTDEPLNSTAASAELSSIAQNATWNGTGLAQGPWTMNMTASVDGSESSFCETSLNGTISGNAMSLSGRCNARLSGATDVALLGSYNTNTGSWTGTVSFTPVALPAQTRSVSWQSSSATADFITGFASGTHTESSYSFNYDVDLIGTYRGNRPLMSAGAFGTYLQNRSAVHSASAGYALSVLNTAGNCFFTMSPTFASEGAQ